MSPVYDGLTKAAHVGKARITEPQDSRARRCTNAKEVNTTRRQDSQDLLLVCDILIAIKPATPVSVSNPEENTKHPPMVVFWSEVGLVPA